MGTPFKTAEEYIAATGTLHSFTGHPGTATAFLVVSAVLTVYFLCKSFTIHH